MSSEVLAVVLAVIGSGALASCVTIIGNLVNRRLDGNSIVVIGLAGLYKERIKYLGNRYIGEKEITNEELSDLEFLYGIYHTRLKQNGHMDTIMSKVRALPINNAKKRSYTPHECPYALMGDIHSVQRNG